MAEELNQTAPVLAAAPIDDHAAQEAESARQRETDEAEANKAKAAEDAPKAPATEAVAVLSGAGASFAGYPLTKYNPVLGARTAKDPNEAASLFQPEHDWWPTAGEADMHRTDREAGMVVHQNMRDKISGLAEAQDGATPVRLSVQAQESMDAGAAEPV